MYMFGGVDDRLELNFLRAAFRLSRHNFLKPLLRSAHTEVCVLLKGGTVWAVTVFRPRLHRHDPFFRRYNADLVDFQARVFARSGLSPTETYLPPMLNPAFVGPDLLTDLDSASKECRMAVCGAVEGLFKKTGLTPTDIDILITTCSIYCPTPSMASMVVNAFGLRKDVQSYHLGGMGCSNGVVGINLVADLLAAHPNSNALFITTEITTPAYYWGVERHRLVTNLLFRMGAAAMLLTNKASLARPTGRGAQGRGAKYQLLRRVRVHSGQNDEAFTAIHFSPDDKGKNGIYLGKNVVKEASRALGDAMTKASATPPSSRPPYRPNFQQSTVRHFLLHAGGAKVLDGLGEALQLDDTKLAPSRTVLHDYGNISSSTTWYTLACVETTTGIKKGERVLQIGVGSGMKCGVNVWRALRDVYELHEAWAHRVSPEQRASLELRGAVDVAHGWSHMSLRALFAVLMVLLAAAMHWLMLQRVAAAAAGSLGARD
ncbi:hypothetical protein VOLCADRAFT_95052 [Volvox carteri f. nagariensis]|uniref:3-ketoacyl-CoA synthase n=1 Tax=Volvox carteri f. nagariensis TaxID=3068 RepID=D8U6G7_VOLCA|nr:uncharacterized protein VOLCADRAFT_95052 [Volvox carteri f. nagariensis]EFJ44710.1 hypothetical protein VOLCADRAFT_95052 [Volvox carteri f. nagariensis]|eukprot:XP_002954286.1 hypothetical protein VOLCADRAFT_95052 [Volvox carteri f. nagariensis]